MLNLFLFSSKLKILFSFDSRCTETVEGSLNGFLKQSILDVLLPTAVEIGCGSIKVGTSPLPSKLYSHFPTYGWLKTMFPLSTTSSAVGEYII